MPSASLVPENDPTTLFTGSGMQPLVPYLLGQPHADGTRLANSQKSFRTDDIEEIGDSRHTTFFEMLGNWSLGDYFKNEQIPWVFQFLTEEIGLDPKRLFVTAFGGDEENGIPRDEETVSLWQKLFAEKGIEATAVDLGTEENGAKAGMQGGRIFYYTKKNWWARQGSIDKMSPGEPGGPDSELFFEFDVEHNPAFGEHCHPNCDCGRYFEIGNSVFMEYRKKDGKGFDKLAKQNVDFGGGLERMLAATNDQPDIFRTDMFDGGVKLLESLSGLSYDDADYTKSFQIILDHVRAAAFLISDGVIPSNTEKGYYVRRLIRRSVRHWDRLGIERGGLESTVDAILGCYEDAYPETFVKKDEIKAEIVKEEEKFRKTLQQGKKEFEKISADDISGKDAFNLYQSYGFPIELTEELAYEKGVAVDSLGFRAELKAHQELSRSSSDKMFKSGLGDTSEMSVRYHTATHLLHQSLRKVLGDGVQQKGSNITPERLRFDFSYPEKMTPEQIAAVETMVNEQIQRDLQVTSATMSPDQAKQEGAIGLFGHKYGDSVSVYTMGDFSKEICTGPHVEHTGGMGKFRIAKEEAVSAGVRRIKAVLE